MSLEVKFAVACRRKFTELTGDSDTVRRCNQCNRDVTNLDVMEEDAAAALLQEASARKRYICVSVSPRLPDTRQCIGTVPPPPPVMATAGAPVPEAKAIIDILIPTEINPDQYAALMKLLNLPNRLAVARAIKGSSTFRLGAFWKWKLQERFTNPLKAVGLECKVTEVGHKDEGYWTLEAK